MQKSRAYFAIKLITAILLVAHLFLRLDTNQPSFFLDLILFNLLGFLPAIIAFRAPLITDRVVAISIGSGLLIWSIGSLLSTWGSFYESNLPEWISEFLYSLFYPLVFFGVIRSFTKRVKIAALELLDTVIIAVGLTSVLTAFLLKPAMIGFEGSAFTVFISILYPVGDIVLLTIALVYALLNPINIRSLLLCFGLFSFAFSDLFFISSSLSGTYTFGSITDDGWILGLFLIALSLSHDSGQIKFSGKISSASATLALIASASLLGIAALSPGYFPEFILLPAFITIALAFIRMSFALQEATTANSERVLARTDELTGLSNRRNFLIELAKLHSGYIFLLDLNGFKSINDSLGHEAGDQLLKQVAARFNRAMSEGALLARLGGDEFGVLAPLDQDGANDLALGISATLSYPFSLLHKQVKIDVSIGFAPISSNEDGGSSCLRFADLAMYEAKRSKSGVLMWQGEK